MSPHFSVGKTVKTPLPITGKGLKRIKEHVLGKHYVLSVMFIGNALAKRLNREYRNKDYPTNILSFPLSKDRGEILINLPLARREANTADTAIRDYVTYLFIHGCLHLKGLRHGAKMKRAETKLSRQFKLQLG